LVKRIRDVLANKEFLKLWIGLTQSRLGTLINLVALSLYVYERTQSGFAVGKLEIAMALPSVVVGLFAGIVVDRFNKKWVMIVSDVLRAILFFVMGFVTNIPSIYVIIFFASLVSLFFVPAYSASIPLIMNKQRLMEANSLSQMSQQIVRIIGPGLAGVMFLKFGFRFICIFNSATYIICAIIILFLNLPNISDERKKWGNFKAPLRDIIEGLRYIKNNRLTASIVVIYGAMQLGAGAIVILAVMFVKDALHGSDAVYGMIISAMAIGSLLGAFTTWFRGKLSEEAVAKYSFIILGLSFVTISFSSNVSLALLFYAVAGISQTIASISIDTLLQKHVPNKIMGRTFSSMGILIEVCQLISMGVGGILSDIIGVRMIYVLGSVIILLAAVGAFKFLSLSESPQLVSETQQETAETPGI
jgi:DHA3 family macrolide efflux protein-like MFS transporter